MYNKVYKKGTKIRLWCTDNFMRDEEEDIIVLENDMSERRLEEMANDFKENTLSPSWGFEVVEDEDL